MQSDNQTTACIVCGSPCTPLYGIQACSRHLKRARRDRACVRKRVAYAALTPEQRKARIAAAAIAVRARRKVSGALVTEKVRAYALREARETGVPVETILRRMEGRQYGQSH